MSVREDGIRDASKKGTAKKTICSRRSTQSECGRWDGGSNEIQGEGIKYGRTERSTMVRTSLPRHYHSAEEVIVVLVVACSDASFRFSQSFKTCSMQFSMRSGSVMHFGTASACCTRHDPRMPYAPADLTAGARRS
eukprot:344475-Hanusia_phi.AAC.3